jgi:GAF domain-containing protein
VLRALDSRGFSGIDQPVLAAFAEQAAIALQNARLAYQLEEEKKRIEFILENSAMAS